MDVDQIILGQQWLYDNDVTIRGRSNMCRFEHEGKEIKLTPFNFFDVLGLSFLAIGR